MKIYASMFILLGLATAFPTQTMFTAAKPFLTKSSQLAGRIISDNARKKHQQRMFSSDKHRIESVCAKKSIRDEYFDGESNLKIAARGAMMAPLALPLSLVGYFQGMVGGTIAGSCLGLLPAAVTGNASIIDTTGTAGLIVGGMVGTVAVPAVYLGPVGVVSLAEICAVSAGLGLAGGVYTSMCASGNEQLDD